MATDATGTPTSPDNLPTINKAVDAPSGEAHNQLAAYVQTALDNHADKPSGIVSGEVPVWNGSAWVRSSVTRIGVGSLGSGTPDSTKYLRGDGSWQTVSIPSNPDPATSLPGSPADGDRAIYTDSVTAPTYSWHFQYDSTVTSQKWRFVGGTPMYAQGSVSALTNGYFDVTGATIIVPLTGQYIVGGTIFGNNTAYGCDPQFMYNGVAEGLVTYGGNTSRVNSYSASKAATAAQVWKAQVRANGSDTTNAHATVWIVPIKVA